MNTVLIVSAALGWVLMNRTPPKKTASMQRSDQLYQGSRPTSAAEIADNIDRDDAEMGELMRANGAKTTDSYDSVLTEHGLSPEKPDLSSTVLESDDSLANDETWGGDELAPPINGD